MYSYYKAWLLVINLILYVRDLSARYTETIDLIFLTFHVIFY